jgi:hypothetical protein
VQCELPGGSTVAYLCRHSWCCDRVDVFSGRDRTRATLCKSRCTGVTLSTQQLAQLLWRDNKAAAIVQSKGCFSRWVSVHCKCVHAATHYLQLLLLLLPMFASLLWLLLKGRTCCTCYLQPFCCGSPLFREACNRFCDCNFNVSFTTLR